MSVKVTLQLQEMQSEAENGAISILETFKRFLILCFCGEGCEWEDKVAFWHGGSVAEGGAGEFRGQQTRVQTSDCDCGRKDPSLNSPSTFTPRSPLLRPLRLSDGGFCHHGGWGGGSNI